MAGLERVQPGDLITSALLNAILDTLAGLDEKVRKCQEALDNLPAAPAPSDEETRTPGEKTSDEPSRPPAETKILIDRIVPLDASPRDIVTVMGRGFRSDPPSPVSIGSKVAKVVKATATSLDVEVPTLGFQKRAGVAVVVGDSDGVHATGKMTVGPPEKEVKTGIALLTVEPAGKVTPDAEKYTLVFSLGSTGKDNLTVAVTAIDPKTRRRKALTSRELSFALQKTQKLEVTLAMPKQGTTIEVTMTKKDEVVASQSYQFVVGENPPLDVEDVFGPKK